MKLKYQMYMYNSFFLQDDPQTEHTDTSKGSCNPGKVVIFVRGLAKIGVPSMLHFDEKIKFHEFCSK